MNNEHLTQINCIDVSTAGGAKESFIGVQETPFEIVSISQASVLLLVLVNDIIIMSF